MKTPIPGDSLPLNQILLGDCVELMNALPEKCVDLIFADPPYNMQLGGDLWRPNMTKVAAVDDDWDKFSSFAEYDAFTRAWLTAARRVLKDTGTIWTMGSYHCVYRMGAILQDLDYWILNDIAWIKCLAGETKVLVRDAQNWVRQRTLADLAAGPSQALEILGPQGWRRLMAVAHSRTLKPKVHLKAGYTANLVGSPEHLVPVWRYNYGQSYLEKPLGHLARESAHAYLMQVDFSSFLPGQYTALDIPQLLHDNQVTAFVRGGYSRYKEQAPQGRWLNYLRQKYAYPGLAWYLCSRDYLPLTIAVAEGLTPDRLTSMAVRRNEESFPAKLDLTEEWGFLIGRYAAEGNMNKQTQVRFSFHRKETHFVRRMEELLRQYGISVYRHEMGNNSLAVYFGSRITRTVIKHFVQGDGARTKSFVMDRVLNAPSAFRQGLLQGFLAGDGHYEAENERYTVGLASPQLVSDLQMLAHSLGYYATTGQLEVGLKATGKRYAVHSLKIYKRRPRQACDIEFHPVKAQATLTKEYHADWYDLVVEGGLFLVEGGLVVHNSNPMPNLKGTRFCNAHETLLWAKKSHKQSKYTFHYKALKAGNDDKQMRSDWRMPICSGGERETIDGKKAHSTQKPEALLHRIISATSNPGDIVLDPFAGTGTTAAVAKRLGRNFITIDRVEAYVGVAEKRLANVSPALLTEEGLFVDAPKPRVPFVSLVEGGKLAVGSALRLKGTDIRATVHADGTLTADGKRGSIHKLGALLLGLPTCNGWTSWFYADPLSGEEQLIDALRSGVIYAQ